MLYRSPKLPDEASQATFAIPGVVQISFFLSFFFLPALGLLCCVQAFSSCIEQELLFAVVRGLLIAVASLVAEHRL